MEFHRAELVSEPNIERATVHTSKGVCVLKEKNGNEVRAEYFF